jgi:hypothetical protein
MMEIEEIKCPLCLQIYNDNENIPLLLPDCGHSFCHSCIHDCYKLMEEEYNESLEEMLRQNSEEEDLTDDGCGSNTKQPQSKPKFIFKCPDDE